MSGSRRWCDRARRSPVAPSRSWWPTTASASSRRFCEHMFEPFAMEGRSASAGTGSGMAIVENVSSRSWAAIFKWKRRWGRGRRSRWILDLRVALDPGRRLVESGLGPASGERGEVSGKRRDGDSADGMGRRPRSARRAFRRRMRGASRDRRPVGQGEAPRRPAGAAGRGQRAQRGSGAGASRRGRRLHRLGA